MMPGMDDVWDDVYRTEMMDDVIRYGRMMWLGREKGTGNGAFFVLGKRKKNGVRCIGLFHKKKNGGIT